MAKKKLKKRRKKKVNIDKILANAILASEKRIESAGTIFASLEEIEKAYPTPSDTVMPRTIQIFQYDLPLWYRVKLRLTRFVEWVKLQFNAEV